MAGRLRRLGKMSPVAATTEPRPRRLTAVLRDESRVTPLELFFDLVYVLALTQCTALMADDPTWEGLARGILVLGVMWWSWVGYAWLTSVVNPEEGAVRLVMFAAMAAFLVVALCVPGAFGDEGLLFAAAYALVRFAQIGLFLIASREDAALRHAVWGLLASTALGAGLLVGASFADGLLQGALWAAALGFDMAGPLVIDPGGWRLEPGHFAERHGLIVIIALGESIVAIGVGAEHGVTTGVVVAACWGWRSPPRCGGCTSTSWRWSPSADCRTPPRGASATRSPATPSPTCTSRWWPGSCCWLWD